MVGMVLLLAYDWLRTRKMPQMHLVSAVLVWVFGTATLHPARRALHPVEGHGVLLAGGRWLFGGTVWIGKTTLLERLLGKSLPEGATVARRALAQCLAGVGGVLPGARRARISGSPTR